MKIKIIDDFLSKSDFIEIKKIEFKIPDDNKIKVYHNSISKNSDTLCECFTKDLIIRLQKNYHHKALEILRELYPEKEKLYNYSEFQIILTGKNYSFPIHDDTPNKLLSGVIYINPQKSSGTNFYENKKKKNKTTIEWKQNRAVFFARKEMKTWHSYNGDGQSTRLVLVYNLMTNNIKEVCKIEKISFLYSYFRYKINPYLYRFFKILI